MEKDKKIWQAVDETMNSLDTYEKVTANPFFYTRLETRIHAENESAGVIERILGFRWIKPTLIGSVVAVNFLVLLIVGFSSGLDNSNRDRQIEEYIAENALDLEDDIYYVYNDKE